MKNKEIEELLNKIRNSIKTHKKLNLDDDMLVVLEFDVIQWNLLLSRIEQLENNRDKAIEVINTQLKNAEGGLKDNLRIIKFNLIKGSCTFEDLKTEEDYKYILKGDNNE